MARWRAALLALILASVVASALPRLAGEVRRARAMLPLEMSKRREAVMPDFYANIRELRRTIPANEPIALIGTSRFSLDQAVFINYYLYPHPTRIYRDRPAYGMAPPGTRPKIVVRTGDARLTSYEEMRAEEFRHSPVVREIVLPPEPRATFDIPIVTSADGPPPASYTIEGALASDGAAQVRLVLEPAGTEKWLTIDGRRTFYDLVYECFGVMEFAAWVRVDSDRPLRAAFWLVNRGPRTAVPIRLIDGPLRAPAPFPVARAPVILWLLNPGDSYVVAHAGTHDALVPPRSLLSLNATGTVRGPVYAFLSEKLPGGQTRFTWPEDVR